MLFVHGLELVLGRLLEPLDLFCLVHLDALTLLVLLVLPAGTHLWLTNVLGSAGDEDQRSVPI